jgi:lysophospholipase L1-like esterase
VTKVKIKNPWLLSKWHAAIAAVRAGTRNATIICVGDSTTMGAGSNGTNGSTTNARVNSYPAQLTSLLADRSAPIPALHQSVNAFSGVSGNGSNYNAYNPTVTFATPTDWTPNINTLGGKAFGSTVSNSRMIWSPPNSVDTFEVIFLTSTNGGTMSVYMDGSATPTESFSVSAGANGNLRKTYSVSLGVHSIEFAKTAGTFVQIANIWAYDSTNKKVNILNAGTASANAATLAANSDNASSISLINAIAPDLTIINTGLNDFPANTAQASFQASLNALIDAATASGSAVLEFPNSRGNANENTFFGYFQNVSKARHVPLLDLRTVFGNLTQANAAGYMSGDSLHPSGLGYGVEAQYMMNSIV